MRQAHPSAGPVVLSRFDLPDAADLMVSSCEDCACPVSRSGDLKRGMRAIVA